MARLQHRRRAFLLAETGLDVDATAPPVKDRVASAFMRAQSGGRGVLRADLLLMILLMRSLDRSTARQRDMILCFAARLRPHRPEA
jgi:hypothetical protein